MIQNLKNLFYRLLRRSESYTKTDMIFLARGGFWLVLGQVISTISGFLFAIAFANLLPKETYGSYKYLLSLFALLAIPTLSGIDTAMIKAVAQGSSGTILSAIKTKIKWGLLGSLLALAVAYYYNLIGQGEISLGLLLMAVFLPFTDPLALYQTYYTGNKDFITLSKNSSLIRIITVSIMLVALYLTQNLILLLIAFLLPLTLLRLYYFLQVKRNLNGKIDVESIKFGKHLSIINIIAAVINQIDKIIIFHYLGAVQLAVYSLATTPPEQIKGVLKHIETISLAKFANRSLVEIKVSLHKRLWLLGGSILAISLLYILGAPWIYRWFFPDYIESVSYSQVFALSLTAAVAVLPLTILQSKSAQHQLYLYKIYTSIVQLTAIITFIYTLGLWGAIIARVITRYASLLIALLLLGRTKD